MADLSTTTRYQSSSPLLRKTDTTKSSSPITGTNSGATTPPRSAADLNIVDISAQKSNATPTPDKASNKNQETKSHIAVVQNPNKPSQFTAYVGFVPIHEYLGRPKSPPRQYVSEK